MHVCHMHVYLHPQVQATGMLSKSSCESESLSSQMLGVTICACHSLVPQHARARETPVQKPAVWGMLFPAGPHECDSNFGATSQSSTQASKQVAAPSSVYDKTVVVEWLLQECADTTTRKPKGRLSQFSLDHLQNSGPF